MADKIPPYDLPPPEPPEAIVDPSHLFDHLLSAWAGEYWGAVHNNAARLLKHHYSGGLPPKQIRRVIGATLAVKHPASLTKTDSLVRDVDIRDDRRVLENEYVCWLKTTIMLVAGTEAKEIKETKEKPKKD